MRRARHKAKNRLLKTNCRPPAGCVAFDEKEETVGQWVSGGHGQGAGGDGELVGLGIELEDWIHGGKPAGEMDSCLVKYGTARGE